MNLVKPSVQKSESYENMPRKSTRDREMIGGCCVCSDERGWDENPLVYCDGQGCNVAVHQGKPNTHGVSLWGIISRVRIVKLPEKLVCFYIEFSNQYC